MIKNISSGGKYLTVSGNPGSTYVNNMSGAQGVGNMRYNTSTQNLEVYNGNSWVEISSGYATVQMTPEAESLLDWAKKKRDEESMLLELAKSNPTIADLLEQIKEKQEQIQVVRNLTELEIKVA